MWILCVLSQPNSAVLLFSHSVLLPYPSAFLSASNFPWAQMSRGLMDLWGLSLLQKLLSNLFPWAGAKACGWPWVSGSWNSHAKCLWGATLSTSFPGFGCWELEQLHHRAPDVPSVLGCWPLPEGASGEKTVAETTEKLEMFELNF